MSSLSERLKQAKETASEDIRQLAMIKILEELKISRPRLEGTLVALLWHIYKGDDESVINYLSRLETAQQLEEEKNNEIKG